MLRIRCSDLVMECECCSQLRTTLKVVPVVWPQSTRAIFSVLPFAVFDSKSSSKFASFSCWRQARAYVSTRPNQIFRKESTNLLLLASSTKKTSRGKGISPPTTLRTRTSSETERNSDAAKTSWVSCPSQLHPSSTSGSSLQAHHR